MSTYRRGSKFHYRFRIDGTDYSGPCPESDVPRIPEGASDREVKALQKKADAYETRLRAEADNVRKNKTVVALVENYKYELTGGKPVPLCNVVQLVRAKPWKKAASEKHWAQKENYWGDFAAFMEAEFPDVEVLGSVRRSHCDAYIAHLAKMGRFVREVVFTRGEGKRAKEARYERDYKLSGKTVAEIVGVCRSFTERLLEDAGLVSNPWTNVVLPDREETSREIFTPAELQRIGDAISGERSRVRGAYAGPDVGYVQWRGHADFCRPLFLIASVTGLTEGDICTLRWEEVDWTLHCIRRRRRKTGNHLEVPLLPALGEYLRGLPRNGEYVLPDYAAMYLENPSGVSYRVKEFLQGLGVRTTVEHPGRRAVSVKDLHSMRHVFCYMAKRSGIPLDLVAKIVGHKTVQMTEHYADHDSFSDLRTAIEKLPPVLFGGSLPAATDGERRRLAELAWTAPEAAITAALAALERYGVPVVQA